MRRKSLPRLFFLLFFFLVFSQVGSQWLYHLFVPFSSSLVEPTQLPSISRSIATVTIIPLVEEWLFREKLLFFLRRYFNQTISILLSSFLFSIVHGQLYFFPFFLGGVVYSVARFKSKKWWFPVLLHIGYNGIALLLNYIEVIW